MRLALFFVVATTTDGFVAQAPPKAQRPAFAVQQEATERGRALAESLRGVNVYLIGSMGAGKSRVGDIVCRMLGSYTFVDTDTTIETAAKQSIASIFEESGEAGFREVEATVLGQVSAYVRLVISTGGGIVLRKSNWAALRTGIVVFLDPTEDVLEQRLRNEVDNRPLLAGDPARIRQLSEERRPLYQQADVAVTVDDPDEPPELTADRLVQAVHKFILDNPPKQPPTG